MKKFFPFFAFLFPILILACSNDGDDTPKSANTSPQYATIRFYNESSYKADIYRYVNPADYDPDLLVASVAAGEVKAVSVIESSDQEIGDTFYIRYNVLMANSLETGAGDLYVQAERDMSNLAFVVAGGQSYTKTIVQPEKDQLTFCNTYLKVHNTSGKSYKILNGASYLPRMGDESYWVNSGDICYYEIPLSWPAKNYAMTQLHFLADGEYSDPESFTMQKGRLYTLTIETDGNFSITDNALTVQ